LTNPSCHRTPRRSGGKIGQPELSDFPARRPRRSLRDLPGQEIAQFRLSGFSRSGNRAVQAERFFTFLGIAPKKSFAEK
jgi:hypothetical protein